MVRLQVYLFRWQPPIWQFAIEFRLPRLGRLSIMGTIDVNAERSKPLPLTTAEIQKIQAEYPNHHILRYYDFENYIYHPQNIAEIAPEDFSKEVYVAEIVTQKNQKLSKRILPTLGASRQNYEEFKTHPKFKDKDVDAIVADLESDELERFYKYFDMKEQFDKSSLASFK